VTHKDGSILDSSGTIQDHDLIDSDEEQEAELERKIRDASKTMYTSENQKSSES